MISISSTFKPYKPYIYKPLVKIVSLKGKTGETKVKIYPKVCRTCKFEVIEVSIMMSIFNQFSIIYFKSPTTLAFLRNDKINKDVPIVYFPWLNITVDYIGKSKSEILAFNFLNVSNWFANIFNTFGSFIFIKSQ